MSVPPTIELGYVTDIGNVRQINEDSILAEVVLVDAPGNPVAVLLVADGLGGHDGGEVASAMAKTAVEEKVVAAIDPNGLFVEPERIVLGDALKLANDRIYEWGNETASIAHPGTTMTAAVIRPGRYVIAHVGDSRAYLVTPQVAEQLTDDDSVVADAVRQGYLTEQEAKVSPYRNQLTRSIGTNDFVAPSLYDGMLDTGDVLLLCSDGFSEYISPDELHSAFLTGEPLQTLCEAFVETAKLRGGHDNISVVAARIGTWDDRYDEVDHALAGKKKTKTGTKRLSLFKPFG